MSANVLLTGATGFIGKIVLAMLLRDRERLAIDKIVLVIRAKKASSVEQRFAKAIASSPCLRSAPRDWQRMITVVEGDLEKPGFGMAEAQYAALQPEITHIIHVAASVDFNLPLAEAARANITSSLNVLDFAARCPRLARMVHTSTAYVTPHRSGPIDAALVPLAIDPASTFVDIERGIADQAALLQRTGHANTYTFTKCVAEHLLSQRRGTVPLTIVRPSIVAASLQFPERGWVDSYAAHTGFVSLYLLGRLDVIIANPSIRSDVVPADIVATRLVSAAFATTHSAFELRYAVSTMARAVSIGEVDAIVRNVKRRLPTGARAARLRMRSEGIVFKLDDFASHKLVFAASDLWLKLTGNQQGRKTVARLRKAIAAVHRDFGDFTQNEFDFRDPAPEPWPAFDPSDYHAAVAEGVYKHLLRLNDRAVEIAGRRHELAEATLPWMASRPGANPQQRVIGAAIRAALGLAADRVTYDRRSFDAALRMAGEGYAVALVPSHRSYLDFLLCSYLLFDQELGLALPASAARKEFGNMPLLGALLAKAGASFLGESEGREDPSLSAFVRERVRNAEPFEFFIEGRRSRTREFLPPQRGVLRAMQESGAPCLIVPIAISYDRVPEEASLSAELSGGAWREPSLGRLARWVERTFAGAEDLGRIHIRAGAPIVLDATSEVAQVSRDTVAALQAAMVCSTFHLRVFLANHPELTCDEARLRTMLEARGMTVVDSGLPGVPPAAPESVCISYEGQIRAWFCQDALQLWPEDPMLRQYAREHWYQAAGPRARTDAESAKVAAALFDPMREVFRAVEHFTSQMPGREHDVRAVARAVNCQYVPWVELALAALKSTPHAVTAPATRREQTPSVSA